MIAKALKKIRCETIEMTIHEWRVFRGGRSTANRGPITQSGDVRGDGRWERPATGGTIEDLA